MKRLVLSAGIILFFAFIVRSQILDPVKWSFSKSDLGNDEFEFVFKATIEKKWHLYSQFVPEGDGMPVKTSFYFYDIKGIEFFRI